VYQWPSDLLQPSVILFLTVKEEIRKQRIQGRGIEITFEEKSLDKDQLFRQRWNYDLIMQKLWSKSDHLVCFYLVYFLELRDLRSWSQGQSIVHFKSWYCLNGIFQHFHPRNSTYSFIPYKCLEVNLWGLGQRSWLYVYIPVSAVLLNDCAHKTSRFVQLNWPYLKTWGTNTFL